MCLLLDGVVPIETGFQQFHPPIKGKDDVFANIGGPGFQQAHRDGRVFAEASGNGGAGGPSADNDIVEGMGGRHGVSSQSASNQPVTAGAVLWYTCFASRYSPMPVGPSSRPMPERLNPPHSACDSWGWRSLIKMVT